LEVQAMALSHRFARLALVLAALAGLALAPPARAIILVAAPNIVLPDGSLGFDLVATSNGAPINPGVLVGLNPQPLPPFPDPTSLSLDLGDPTGPIATSTGSGGVFALQWWMNAPGGLVFPSAIPAPDGNGNVQFAVDGAGGNSLFEVSFHVGPGPVDPASWVMLNPQPLPPKVGYEGFAVQFADPTAVEFHVSELMPNGAPVVMSFSLVPEPASVALIAAGLVGIGGARGHSRRRAPHEGRGRA
jgi:hypothetical protein